MGKRKRKLKSEKIGVKKSRVEEKKRDDNVAEVEDEYDFGECEDVECDDCHKMYDFCECEIFVPVKYEVVNGVSGLLRDLILRLFEIFWYKDEEIRAMMGMSREHFQWKDHRYFLHNRPTSPFFSDGSHTPFSCSLSLLDASFPFGQPKPISVNLKSFTDRTVLVEKIINEGFYHLAVRIKYEEKNNPGLSTIGGAQPLWRCHQWEWRVDGLSFDTETQGFLNNVNNPLGDGLLLYPHLKVPSNSLLKVEFNASANVLSFFLNGKKYAYSISEIYPPLRLGVLAAQSVLFTPLFFGRRPYPTMETHTPSSSSSSSYSNSSFSSSSSSSSSSSTGASVCCPWYNDDDHFSDGEDSQRAPSPPW